MRRPFQGHRYRTLYRLDGQTSTEPSPSGHRESRVGFKSLENASLTETFLSTLKWKNSHSGRDSLSSDSV